MGEIMEILALRNRDEIKNVTPLTNAIHFSYRSSNLDVMEAIGKSRSLKRISTPSSYMKTIGRSTKKIVEMYGIELVIDDIWGQRTDLHGRLITR
jgi:hypothetical protein